MAAPRAVILADDLTGAMDAAGPFASRGLVTRVAATVEGCAPAALTDAEVVSINADTRHLGADRAAERVRQITSSLIDSRAEILIKKIDSTMRGNVVAETLAMLRASGRPHAIIAPAFPAQGRTVRNGVVHVNGTPLSQTAFARDALSAPPLEPIPELFRRAGASPVHAYAIPLPDSIAQGTVVLDSQSDADLQTAVRAFAGQLRGYVLVGSAGIAQAVCDVCFADRLAPDAPSVDAEPLLFVVGSRAQQSAVQVSALQALGATVFDAPGGEMNVDAIVRARAGRVVVRASSGSVQRDAAAVAGDLAAGVAAVLAERAFGAMVATGGDTAIAILKSLEQPVLTLIGELLPGIPYSRIRGSRGDLLFVTKAGGFGAPDAFATIARKLGGELSARTQSPTGDTEAARVEPIKSADDIEEARR